MKGKMQKKIKELGESDLRGFEAVVLHELTDSTAMIIENKQNKMSLILSNFIYIF